VVWPLGGAEHAGGMFIGKLRLLPAAAVGHRLEEHQQVERGAFIIPACFSNEVSS
jgi:hypothetical protein